MSIVTQSLRKSAVTAGSIFLATISLAFGASAQSAFTNRPVNLHAGPDRNYPTVSVIGPGAAVYVNGCLRNFNWCDVSAGPARGWAHARQLNYTYGGRALAIYGNGGRFGLPVVGYTMGAYWDTHYRAQPWYSTHRHHWHPRQAYVAPHPVERHPEVSAFAPARPTHWRAPVAPPMPEHRVTQPHNPYLPPRPVVVHPATAAPMTHAPRATPHHAPQHTSPRVQGFNSHAQRHP